MGTVTETIKCPKCGFYNEETEEGCIIEVDLRDGEEFVAQARAQGSSEDASKLELTSRLPSMP